MHIHTDRHTLLFCKTTDELHRCFNSSKHPFQFSKRLHQTPFNNPLMELWRLKTSPSCLMEKVATASSHNFWGRTPSTRGKRRKKNEQVEVGRNKCLWIGWPETTSNQKRQKPLRWCVNPCRTSLSTWSQAGPFWAVGDQSRGSVYTAGTLNYSLSDPSGTPRRHAALQRHGKETRPSSAIFRQYFQHSENSEQWKQHRCRVLINLSCSGRIMTPTSGRGEYQFHTSESSPQGKYSQWRSERDRVTKIKLKNRTHYSLFLLKLMNYLVTSTLHCPQQAL